MQKFDTPAPISTVLDIPAGRIQVIAADRADSTVQVLPADTANGRDVKVAEQTKVVSVQESEAYVEQSYRERLY